MDKEKQSKLLKMVISLGLIAFGLYMMIAGLINYAEFGSPAQIGYGFIVTGVGIYWMMKLFQR